MVQYAPRTSSLFFSLDADHFNMLSSWNKWNLSQDMRSQLLDLLYSMISEGCILEMTCNQHQRLTRRRISGSRYLGNAVARQKYDDCPRIVPRCIAWWCDIVLLYLHYALPYHGV